MFEDCGGTLGTDINFRQKVDKEEDEADMYPLLVAASTGDERMIKMLLENKGLNLQIKDRKGVNAFWIATMFGHGKAMKVLAEAGIDVLNKNMEGINSLHLAVILDLKNIVRLLIDSNFPDDLTTNDGMTAMHLAALFGR
jgi:thiosulfate/3-mercaptopyruvate sulfurtransferase